MVGVRMDASVVMAAYSQTLRRLAQLSGFDQRQVLLAEAGVILKTWAGRTKVGTVEKADRAARLRAIRKLGYTGSNRQKDRGDVTVNAGYRPAPFGRVWIKVRKSAGQKSFILARGPGFAAPTGSATFTWHRRRLHGANGGRSTSAKWMANVVDAQQDVESALKRAIPAGRASIGLSRQSVLQIADSLGIDLLRVEGGGTLSAAGIAKARAAMASTGKSYRNGYGAQGGAGGFDYVDLINRLPYGRAIGMDRMLLGVLAGRAKYFERSYAKGAFDSQRRACAAYPNLFRVTAAA